MPSPSLVSWSFSPSPFSSATPCLPALTSANLFAYVAIFATSLLVGAIIANRPAAFDLGVFKLGGIYVVVFELTMLVGAPSVFGEHAREASAATFLATVCAAFVLTTASIAFVAKRDSPQWDGGGLDARSIDNIARVLAATSALVVGAYIALTPVLPLVEAFRGARSTDLARAREQALTQLSSPGLSYLFGAVRDTVLPTASAILLLQFLRHRGLARFARFAIVASLALLAAAVTTEKSPVGRLVLVLLFTVWISRRSSMRWRSLIVAGVLFVGFPFAIGRLSNSQLNSNANIASVIGERMFRVPPSVHYHYIAFVDSDIHQLLGGRTIPNLGKFAAGPNVTITTEVQKRIFPNAEVQGNANGSYISNLYVDFGWLGVIAGSIAAGVLIVFLDTVNRHHLPREIGIPLQAVTAVQLVFITSVSLFDSIFQFPFGNIGLLAAFSAFIYFWLPLRRRVVFRRSATSAPHLDALTEGVP